MKVKTKPNGDTARRRAIKKLKNQFYFLFKKPRRKSREFKVPLWGIAIAIFILFQSCENTSQENFSIVSQNVSEVTVNAKEDQPGSLLFLQEDVASLPEFTSDYLRYGYRDDLYMRRIISRLQGKSQPSYAGADIKHEVGK